MNSCHTVWTWQLRLRRNLRRALGSRMCSTTSAEIPTSHIPNFLSSGRVSSSLPELIQTWNGLGQWFSIFFFSILLKVVYLFGVWPNKIGLDLACHHADWDLRGQQVENPWFRIHEKSMWKVDLIWIFISQEGQCRFRFDTDGLELGGQDIDQLPARTAADIYCHNLRPDLWALGSSSTTRSHGDCTKKLGCFRNEKTLKLLQQWFSTGMLWHPWVSKKSSRCVSKYLNLMFICLFSKILKPNIRVPRIKKGWEPLFCRKRCTI